MAKSSRKPRRRSRANAKERLKARNKKRAGVGKAHEPSCASVSCTASSSEQLQSVQADDGALALEEETVKMREALNTFLYLKEENQSLKFQILCLQTLLQSQRAQPPDQIVEMFPSVPTMIPVATGQEHCVEHPQHVVELEEVPESERKATADDNKPAGFVSEDHCESAGASAIKEVEPEREESFEPSHQCLQNGTSTAYSHLSTGVAVVHPACERRP